MRSHRPTVDGWVGLVVEDLATLGYAIVEGVLDSAEIDATRQAMYRVQQAIHAMIGPARLEAAGELGVLRLMIAIDPHFLRLLELDPMLRVVDATLGSTAILHLQNGFILPSLTPGQTP